MLPGFIMMRDVITRTRRYLSRPSMLKLSAAVLLVVAYFAAGRFCLSLTFVDIGTTAVWPPTGIALGALLVLGYRFWPAIFAGAFLLNVTTVDSMPMAAAIAVANTVEALATAYLVNRFANGRKVFERPYAIFLFVFFMAAMGALSASIGVTKLMLEGMASWDNYGSVWLSWWVGDTTSDLIVTPVLLLWATNPKIRWDRAQWREAVLLLVALLFVGRAVFDGLSFLSTQNYPVQYFVIPFVVWFAYRFGPREAATAGLILSAIAIDGTLDGYGPFGSFPPEESFILLEGFMGTVTVMGLILGSVVTQHRRTEDSQHLLATIVESSNDAIIGKTLDGTILSWNLGAERMFGYAATEVIGEPISMLVPPYRFDEMPQLLERIRNGERIERYETSGRSKNGQRVNVSLTISPIKDAKGNICGASAIAHDISERKRAEERIRFLAQHDALTGLPNRVLFGDRMGQAITQARRNRQQVAMLFIDLDGFKHINDSLGHQIGDRVLRMAAGRLQRCVRDGDSVARLGGDEFVISLPTLSQSSDAMLIANKVLEILREPFIVEEHELHISGSIGISIFPTDGEDTQALMRAADIAMYHAKEKGRNNYQFFTSRLNDTAQRRLVVANRLHQAWQRGELVLDYQPQVDLENNKIYATEALIRWGETDLGIISPCEFVRVAEEIGLIVPIGEWVLRQACQQVSRWRQAGYANLGVAVNLSPQQFRRPGFPDLVARILKEANLPPEALEMEITEGVLMAQSLENLAVLEQLAAPGVRLAVDDFGTGYSSLAYLQRFPIHTLKVDQSFVGGIEKNENDAAIVTAIIAMAHSLRLKVVAEGVETLRQAEFLKRHGCLAAQGFYYSKPVPAHIFGQLLGALAQPLVKM